MDTSAEKPPGRRLGTRFRAVLPPSSPAARTPPRRPSEARSIRTSWRDPETQARRHSPHGHAAPTPGRPYDERVPGGRQAALRGAGSRGRQLQRAPQRAKRRAGQLRLQQEDTAHRQRQEAGVRRAAPKRHGDGRATPSARSFPGPRLFRLGVGRRRHAPRHACAPQPPRGGLGAELCGAACASAGAGGRGCTALEEVGQRLGGGAGRGRLPGTPAGPLHPYDRTGGL